MFTTVEAHPDSVTPTQSHDCGQCRKNFENLPPDIQLYRKAVDNAVAECGEDPPHWDLHGDGVIPAYGEIKYPDRDWPWRSTPYVDIVLKAMKLAEPLLQPQFRSQPALNDWNERF